MNMKKMVMVILFSLFFLSGCQKEEPDKPLKIRLSGLQQASEKTFFRTFVMLFEAEHGIDIELEYESPDTMFDSVSTDTSVADVIMVDTARMSPYIEGNFMSNIDFIDYEADRTFTTLFDAYTHKRVNRYFVPVSMDVYLSIYNKEALPYMPISVGVERNEQNDVTEITNITWQMISTWAKNIKQETDEAKFGFPYGQISSQLLYPITGLGLSMGIHQLPSFTDPGAVKAWQFLYDLKQHDALAYGPTFGSLNQPTELLSSNELWISFGHMGPIGSAYLSSPSKYILGPIPKDESTNLAGTTAGAWAYGILNESKNQKAAQAWIKFITDPEINYLYCSGLGGVISPIMEVRTHLGTSNSDKIMAMGISMLDDDVKAIVVDTSHYTSWNDVKLLYTELYQKLIEGFTIDGALLNVYQESLEALEKT